MLERKQGSTYLADQTQATNVKLGHMAGFVAAGDACPAAAVMAPLLPRGENVMCVFDSSLEGQQRVSLAWPAARMDAGHDCGEEQGEVGD
jgi:hypothetical protein